MFNFEILISQPLKRSIPIEAWLFQSVLTPDLRLLRRICFREWWRFGERFQSPSSSALIFGMDYTASLDWTTTLFIRYCARVPSCRLTRPCGKFSLSNGVQSTTDRFTSLNCAMGTRVHGVKFKATSCFWSLTHCLPAESSNSG